MAGMTRPTYAVLDDHYLDGIRVSGLSGVQPTSQAKWYLLRGFKVHHPETDEQIIVKLTGSGEEARYVLYLVRYPDGYEPRTREPPYNPEVFDLGLWKDVYRRQVQVVDSASKKMEKTGLKVTPRKWREHEHPVVTKRGDSEGAPRANPAR